METLIVHDLEGHIYSLLTAPFKVPVGMPYIITEVPDGMYIAGVDAERKEPIFGSYPRKESDILSEKIDAALIELSTLIAMGGEL